MVFPHFSTYCVNKDGIRMLMRDLPVELGPKNVAVNDIAPGAISAAINADLLSGGLSSTRCSGDAPLGRLGSVEDVAALAAFLASDDAAYVTGSTYFCRWRSHPELPRTVIVDRGTGGSRICSFMLVSSRGFREVRWP